MWPLKRDGQIGTPSVSTSSIQCPIVNKVFHQKGPATATETATGDDYEEDEYSYSGSASGSGSESGSETESYYSENLQSTDAEAKQTAHSTAISSVLSSLAGSAGPPSTPLASNSACIMGPSAPANRASLIELRPGSLACSPGGPSNEEVIDRRLSVFPLPSPPGPATPLAVSQTQSPLHHALTSSASATSSLHLPLPPPPPTPPQLVSASTTSDHFDSSQLSGPTPLSKEPSATGLPDPGGSISGPPGAFDQTVGLASGTAERATGAPVVLSTGCGSSSSGSSSASSSSGSSSSSSSAGGSQSNRNSATSLDSGRGSAYATSHEENGRALAVSPP
ncbi:unnamed protein product [Protopolystoma xenopodis]|uniref:Uncharacterized protein n=1 Tax=Protopolystoma xenopodis TaxID=117903 RepID=A0A3S5CE31_9PLAT|nr:unnamed protein product [Protopolystoma xenopodis]